MPEIDSIRIVSEGLTAINLRLANTLPSEPGFDELEHRRNEVHNRLIFLVRKFITTTSQRFVDSESDLAVINAGMKKTLNSLAGMQQTIESVTRFVAAIDKFINVVIPFL